MNTRNLNRPCCALIVVLLAAATGGCTVGPDFRQPAPPEPPRYTEAPLPAETVGAPVPGGAAQRFVPGGTVAAQWWTLFRSEPLDRLLRDAVAGSPTLAAAQATLRQARELQIAGTGALRYPSVDGSLGASRVKAGDSASGQGGIFDVYNATVSVSYMLDLFGRNTRELEGLQAQVDYRGYQLDGAYLALTANLVTAAVREASLRAQIAATQEIVAAEAQQLDLVRRQFELGGIARLAVVAQGTQVAQTRATLPPLERDLARTRHLIATLAGQLPGEATLPAFELASFELPQELPVSLPSELVRQRPDIRAAEALLHRASAAIGVATANLYPQITLSGSFGTQSGILRDWLGGPAAWSIGAALLQPLFNGGQLEAERRAAIAAYDAAAAQYRDTVLQAFKEVADALRALDDDARTLAAQASAEALSRETLDLTRRQHDLGAVGYLALLVAQRQHQQARLALVQAQATRYADVAALFGALGGGWWDRGAASAATAPNSATASTN